MAASTRKTAEPEPGDTWLANCARRPQLAYEVWEMGGLAPIHCTRWLAAETQLVTALQAVRRLPTRESGPLLMDFGLDTAWWLVPLDAAEQLADVRLITLRPHGWPLHCPPTHRAAAGRVWLEAPDGSGRVIDPVYLAAVLGPGGGPRLPAEAFG
ncbi:hypothetical protein [Streptomyces sp. NPDC021622]|uniref:hypothetical protein n=1 Tax=Streptomyces sp. NPDC021622 TaxID=3155013 RepID=UPI0033FCD9C4